MEILELKNMVTETKTLLDGLNSRMEETEERTGLPEERTLERST